MIEEIKDQPEGNEEEFKQDLPGSDDAIDNDSEDEEEADEE